MARCSRHWFVRHRLARRVFARELARRRGAVERLAALPVTRDRLALNLARPAVLGEARCLFTLHVAERAIIALGLIRGARNIAARGVAGLRGGGTAAQHRALWLLAQRLADGWTDGVVARPAALGVRACREPREGAEHKEGDEVQHHHVHSLANNIIRERRSQRGQGTSESKKRPARLAWERRRSETRNVSSCLCCTQQTGAWRATFLLSSCNYSSEGRSFKERNVPVEMLPNAPRPRVVFFNAPRMASYMGDFKGKPEIL
jgi:hypothetical protein